MMIPVKGAGGLTHRIFFIERKYHDPEQPFNPFRRRAYHSIGYREDSGLDDAHKCINCMECVAVCPQKAHTLRDGVHIFHRERCTGCGACQRVCLGEALGLKNTLPEALPTKEQTDALQARFL